MVTGWIAAAGAWASRLLTGLGIFQLGDWFGDSGEEEAKTTFNLFVGLALLAGIIGGIIIGKKILK